MSSGQKLNEADAHRNSEPIKAKLLGTFELAIHGKRIVKVPRPVQQLFAQLALAGTAGKARADLAAAFWPDTSTERSLFYLRRALSQLRAVLGIERSRLSADENSLIHLNLSGCVCDAVRFRELVGRSDVASLSAAVQLYTGPFLLGTNADWIRPLRDGFQESLIQVLEDLAISASEQGELDSAVTLWHKALQTDPLRESIWRGLMRALAQKGDFVGIARTYRDLQNRLRSELGLGPTRETIALYRSLLADAKLVPVAAGELPPGLQPSSPLPNPVTSFIGRAQELIQTSQALRDNRLVTLTGIGGVGKTRLALEVAREIKGDYPDGVYLVELSETTATVSVLSRLESALGATLDGRSGTCDSIADAIGSRRILLLIDDAERFVQECSALAQELLERCEELRILCTSRRPLRCSGERVVPLHPLLTPSDDRLDLSSALESDAVRLFLDRAGAAAPSFRLTDRNTADIARICRRLDGLPLALELAAVRLRHLSPLELAARLDDRFRLLGSPKDPQERHSTLEAALEWSFDILSRPEQVLFARLSIFPGTWTLADVVGICSGESLTTEDVPELLGYLVEHSLVEFDSSQPTGRYRMLESVRAYARTKLSKARDEARVARSFSEHYIRVLEDSKLMGSEGASDEDDHNFVAALEGCMSRKAPEDLRVALRLVNALFPYWYRTGRLSQGFALASRVVSLAGSQLSDALVEALFRTGCAAHSLYKLPESDSLLSRAEEMADALELESWSMESLRFRGELAANQGLLEAGRTLLEEALDRFRAVGDQGEAASCLGTLGYIARQSGEFDQASSFTEQAMTIFTVIGDSEGSLWCLGSLGAIHADMGRYDLATPVLLEVLRRHRRSGNLSAQAWNLTMLAEVALRSGDVEAAGRYVDEALSIHKAESDGLILLWPMRIKGQALQEAGDLNGAEEVLQEALRLSRAAGAAPQEAYTLIRLSDLKLSQHDPSTAWAYHQAAGVIAGQVNIPALTRELASNEARIESAQKDRA